MSEEEKKSAPTAHWARVEDVALLAAYARLGATWAPVSEALAMLGMVVISFLLHCRLLPYDGKLDRRSSVI